MNDTRGIIRPAGETEAGAAGTQPARDSRQGLRPQVDAGIRLPSGCWIPGPLAACGRSSPMPQKIHPWNTRNRPTVGRISCLAELGSRPIQAEPVHLSPMGELGPETLETTETQNRLTDTPKVRPL